MVGAAPALIELRGINRIYGGPPSTKPAVQVLFDVSLSIEPGEFVAIVGASGSGKSTLMNLLGCLDRPSSGTYWFQGRDVAQLNPDELAALRRETFGFVFQGYHLIPTETASENVQMPAIYAGMDEDARAARAAELLSSLGLADKLDNRPNQLSGGQQQRVSIARALMNGGRVILADEPTGALDSRSGAEVMTLLRKLSDSGHTIILITHDHEVAAMADRIIEIRDGCILSDSRPETALESKPTQPLPPPEHCRSPWLSEIKDAARSALRSMFINRHRTALTLLGVIIGVASVIVMLAVGEGARQRVVEQMGTMGTTIMYLGSYSPSNGFPRGELTQEDLDAIAELPLIRRVMPVIGDPITVRRGSVDRQVYVFAANETMPDVHHWPLAQGRYYTDAEDRDLAPLVVLGHRAAKHFFSDREVPLGQKLLIGNSPFEVIGVMQERGADSGVEDYDDMVFIPYLAARARVYQAQTQPDYVVVEAQDSATVLEAEQSMRQLLLQRHGGREDFSIGNAAARLQAEASTRQSMSMMLGLIAAVSLVVGGIGVMNVMLMTVRERTREIGIRMATGARQSDIMRQFLTEAVLLTITGGCLGVLAGAVVGIGLIFSGVDVVFSLRAALGAFGCAVVTGMVFGYMPARTAAALDPVQALAGE
ncbi:ABC transporter permease [Alcaligenes faecalis]|uniref:ABC transporter permease n=1 Tax=Alcaligenes faecalis TaxID=511 RepID=UPI002932BAD8|nr:ABC transporter permease [Alcaligenes faecalis]MDV2117815.1 ABC transporter permease [Alcaligenes faecalis]